MANINFVINASSPATADRLRARLAKVKVQWEPLALRLKQRTQQLLFEKVQSEALDNLHEAVKELEGQPQSNLSHQEVEDHYKQLMEFFQDIDSFVAQSEFHHSQLESTLQPLLGHRDWLLGYGKGAKQLLESVVEGIRDGYRAVEEQLKVQKGLLEQWRTEWSTFHSAQTGFQEWVGQAEGVVSRDCYGNDVVETERYLKAVTELKAKLSAEEKKVEELVEFGNTLLESVGKGTPVEAEVDTTLTDSETRWYNLVEKVEGLESDIRKILITWRAYATIFHGARSFISQMTKMVGTEPVESSNGNITLLPTYRTYADQVRAMQVQYDKFLMYGAELAGNPAVGGRDSVAMETRELRSDWERLKDNVMDSLALLQREYDDWVHHQLQQMSTLVKGIDEIVCHETRFVEEMPLESFLQEETEPLLREADSLVACQDQLAQLEGECVALDERLLERAMQQGQRHEGGEGDSNTEEHLHLQTTRDRHQEVAEAITPVINIFYLQLQLLQKIQGGRKVVVRAMEAVGNQEQLENLLSDITFTLSDDHFEQLRSDAYDLGTVSEDCEMEGAEQYGLKLPPYEQLVQINRGLTGEIESLSDDSTTAKIRLQLFIEWWVEFHSNHGDVCRWLEEAESRVGQLEARAQSTQSPLVSPLELLSDARELESEMEEKEVLLSALSSTARNITEEFATLREGEGEGEGGETRAEVGKKIEELKARWEALQSWLRLQLQEHEVTSDKFSKFLTSFTGFCNWLCEMHGQLLDELCVAIPHRASEDTIAVHKARLKDFQELVSSRGESFDSLRSEGGREGKWGEYLVPDDMQSELPSDDSQPQSPAPEGNDETDFPFEEHLAQLPYFRNKIRAMATKWADVQRLLRDRENQLEMSLGNMVVFLEGVDGFLSWVREQGALECLCSGPPADLSELQTYQTVLTELREAMAQQDSVRLGLQRAADNLIGQVSGPNASHVRQKVEEIGEKWGELTSAVETRSSALGDLIGRIEVLLVRVGECEGVLEEGEGWMTESGPIGADLDRLVEQQEILDALDEELLNKKKIPEEVMNEAMNIIKDCREGSGESLMSRVRGLQNRFDQLVENCYESRELCEEATAAMQSYQTRETVFTEWLEAVQGKLTERVATKKPIGTVHNEAEEFLDFMKEMEQHTEQYGELRCHGDEMAVKYKPSDALDEMMSSLHHRWEEFVARLCAHSDKLNSLAGQWDHFERDVKNLLNWLMDEANRFSGEVTTQGDKGIEDHIESCKVFSETLEGKKEKVTEIQTLADELREEDGAKSNGTCDVDSRWNDVNQHWGSLCKLLLETLLRLEATYAEVQHVLLIRSEEFDWLGHSEAAADQRCCHGDLDRVQEEIVRQQQLLIEVEGHDNEVKFIDKTVEFLLEHTRKPLREEIKEKAADFGRRYDDLLRSLQTYVGNLEASIPVWREFNAVSQELCEWLDHAHLQLTSDLMQPGNAVITETSLRNVELLSEEVAGHESTLHTLTTLSSTLSQLTPPGDKEYVSGVRDQLVSQTGDLTERTRDRADVLEQRLRSWQVFPVAEAQAVQAFLQQVQAEMGGGGEGRDWNGEGEEDEEDSEEEEMSSEQLLEKLQRLEELQQLQQTNRDKLSTISQSVESAEVRAALEKNPDISKERSNLLQGWSSMSEALIQRIAAMKQKATMVGEVEGALERVCGCVREYREEVGMPLPSSAQLEDCHDDITQRQTALNDQFQTELTSLQNVFDRYSSGPDLLIPPRLTDRAAAAKEEFHVVSRQAEEKTELMRERLELWEELRSSLPRLSHWMRGALSELSCLRNLPDFATEFSSFETRLEDLKEQVAENEDSVQRLQTLAPDHLPADDTATETMREQYGRIEEGWRALNEGIGSLEVAMVPWKELTDRFDELCDWFDGLRERVRTDLLDLEREDDNSADMTDHLVVLKDHLLKMEQQASALAQLTNQRASLLSHDICSKYQPAHDLDEQIMKLEETWADQEQVLRHTLGNVEEKVSEWKAEAVHSIRSVRSMTEELTCRAADLSSKEREIERQNEEIRELQEQLKVIPIPSQPQKPSSSSSLKYLIFLLLLLVLGFIILSVIFHDLGPHLDLSPLVFQRSTSPFKPI